MRLKDVVKSHEGRLSTGDRRLIDAFLGDPRGVALASTTEAARLAGVHPSSLVRLAQKLGFSGFPELRTCLREELMPATGRPSERLRRRLDELPARGILDAVIEGERASLDAIKEHVAAAEIDRAAETLAAARRVLVFAEGGARALREWTVDRIRRLGRLAEPLEAEPRAASVALTGLGADDVVLGFAFVRVPRLLPGVLATAAEAGAKTLVVADLGGPLIRPSPDLLLSAPRGPGGRSQSLVVPMTLCHALILTLSAVLSEEAEAAAETYQRLRLRLGVDES